MSSTVSYVNLLLLLVVSTCHVILSVFYHDQCPSSPFLSMTLGITGLLGIILSIIAAISHCCTAYDGSTNCTLALTYVLLVYLIVSRTVLSIMAFRLASQKPDPVQCVTVLYWSSTLLVVMSYSVIIITSCVLIKFIVLSRRNSSYYRSSEARLSTGQL